MSDATAFLPLSNTMLVTTNGVANTASAQPAVFPGQGATAMGGNQVPPPVALIENLGNAVVWVSITIGVRVAAIPAAGNTTLEVPVQPGQMITLRAPWGGVGQEGAAGNPQTQGPAGSTTLQINTISPGVSQNITVTFGEGV